MSEVATIANILSRNYLTGRDLYQDIINHLVDASSSAIGYLHLYNEVTQEIELAVWSDEVISHCMTSHETHYPIKEAGIWADCVRLRKPVIHNDYGKNYKEQSGVLPKGHIKLIRHFSFPVYGKSGIEAIIGLGNSEHPYDIDEVERIATFVNVHWASIVNKIMVIDKERDSYRQSNISTDRLFLDMIGAISKALELRDEYTSHHQKNVSFICEQIGRELQLPDAQIFGLSLGALVHDIGKIAIPAEILNKPGKLLDAEINLLKIHPERGAIIFNGVSFPWPIQEMVCQHHERMDGSGYPKGLCGDNICLEARIIAVADIYDAMASDRPYRESQGHEKAIKEIKAQRGITLDPYVVDAFLRCAELDPSFNGRYKKAL